MAINLDENLLKELGLDSLPDAEKDSLFSHIYETLETRVGMRLADQMTDEQLAEFDKFYQAKDESGAFHWLETNFPNYKEIVQNEFNNLKEEVKQSAPQILEATRDSANQNIGPTPPQPGGGTSIPQPPTELPQ